MKSIQAFKPTRLKFNILFLAFIFGGFLPGSRELQANPVAIPIITEILFNEEGYQLELLLWDSFDEDFLDNFRVVGLYDIGYFIQGIQIPSNGLMVISQNDFEPEFFINPEGDALHAEFWDGFDWQNIDWVPMIFGEVPEPYQSWVSAQKGEESVSFQVLYGMPMSECWAVKELPHTIGSSPLEVSLREEFSGYVRNLSGQPLPYITLKYCEDWFHWSVPHIITDINGYFYTDSMFCRKYNVIFMDNDIIIYSAIIFIEPDSANYFEFTIDYLPSLTPEITPSAKDFSLRVLPNPAVEQVRFIIETSDPDECRKGVIKIYNSGGIIVSILPVETVRNKENVLFEPFKNQLSPGHYICTLEIDGKKLASEKMVLAR